MRPLVVVCRAILVLGSAIAVGAASALGVCGPFTDVLADPFCPYVLEIFTVGITTGTTPTTYDPTLNVSRLQMAAFLSRSVNAIATRGSRRTAMNQFYAPNGGDRLGQTTLSGVFPYFAVSDGTEVWVPVNFNRVDRVRGSDGRLLETWTGAGSAFSAVAALGRIVVSGGEKLYMIDPKQSAGAVTTVATGLGTDPGGMAFDGSRFYLAHQTSTSAVTIVFPGATIPWTSFNVTAGFQDPLGAVFDGTNVWITDATAGTLLKLDSGGVILQTVTIGFGPENPGFDGTNIFVPTDSGTVAVVRPSTGAILTTLAGNGMNNSRHVAFDGERILVTNYFDTVSLWRASDLSPLGFFSTGTDSRPWGACSDGINFWVVLQGFSGNGRLARF